MSRINWVTSEKNKLVEKTYEIMTEATYKGKSVSVLDAFRDAQREVLHPSRVRNIKALTTVPWLKKGLADLASEKESEGKALAEEEKMEELRKQNNLAEISTEKLLAELTSRMIANFIAPLTESIKQGILDSLQSNVSISNEPTVKHKPFGQIPSRRDNKPVITIVGLLPDQTNEVKKYFGDKFSFNFWKDGDTKTLRQYCSNSYRVVCVTSFISHPNEAVVISATEKGRYIRHNGGIKALKMLLTRIHSAIIPVGG